MRKVFGFLYGEGGLYLKQTIKHLLILCGNGILNYLNGMYMVFSSHFNEIN